MTNVVNAISHAINAISDECDKSDTYHTCDIALLIPRPHLLLGVRRISNLNGPPHSLNYVGSATITGAMTSNLKPKDYRTGFDIYLLDEKGAEIIGPTTFFLVMTKAMNDAVKAETARVPNNKLAKLDNRKKRANASKEEKPSRGRGSTATTRTRTRRRRVSGLERTVRWSL